MASPEEELMRILQKQGSPSPPDPWNAAINGALRPGAIEGALRGINAPVAPTAPQVPAAPAVGPRINIGQAAGPENNITAEMPTQQQINQDAATRALAARMASPDNQGVPGVNLGGSDPMPAIQAAPAAPRGPTIANAPIGEGGGGSPVTLTQLQQMQQQTVPLGSSLLPGSPQPRPMTYIPANAVPLNGPPMTREQIAAARTPVSIPVGMMEDPRNPGRLVTDTPATRLSHVLDEIERRTGPTPVLTGTSRSYYGGPTTVDEPTAEQRATYAVDRAGHSNALREAVMAHGNLLANDAAMAGHAIAGQTQFGRSGVPSATMTGANAAMQEAMNRSREAETRFSPSGMRNALLAEGLRAQLTAGTITPAEFRRQTEGLFPHGATPLTGGSVAPAAGQTPIVSAQGGESTETLRERIASMNQRPAATPGVTPLTAATPLAERIQGRLAQAVSAFPLAGGHPNIGTGAERTTNQNQIIRNYLTQFSDSELRDNYNSVIGGLARHPQVGPDALAAFYQTPTPSWDYQLRGDPAAAAHRAQVRRLMRIMGHRPTGAGMGIVEAASGGLMGGEVPNGYLPLTYSRSRPDVGPGQ